MKKDERNKMLQRYTDLLNREDSLIALLATASMGAIMFTEISNIFKETQSELLQLKDLKDNKIEFLFNFKSGGWNSEWAFYEEQAIRQAIEKYEGPGKINPCLIDTKSFRVSTPVDHNALLSNFY